GNRRTCGHQAPDKGVNLRIPAHEHIEERLPPRDGGRVGGVPHREGIRNSVFGQDERLSPNEVEVWSLRLSTPLNRRDGTHSGLWLLCPNQPRSGCCEPYQRQKGSPLKPHSW